MFPIEAIVESFKHELRPGMGAAVKILTYVGTKEGSVLSIHNATLRAKDRLDGDTVT